MHIPTVGPQAAALLQTHSIMDFLLKQLKAQGLAEAAARREREGEAVPAASKAVNLLLVRIFNSVAAQQPEDLLASLLSAERPEGPGQSYREQNDGFKTLLGVLQLSQEPLVLEQANACLFALAQDMSRLLRILAFAVAEDSLIANRWLSSLMGLLSAEQEWLSGRFLAKALELNECKDYETSRWVTRALCEAVRHQASRAEILDGTAAFVFPKVLLFLL